MPRLRPMQVGVARGVDSGMGVGSSIPDADSTAAPLAEVLS